MFNFQRYLGILNDSYGSSWDIHWSLIEKWVYSVGQQESMLRYNSLYMRNYPNLGYLIFNPTLVMIQRWNRQFGSLLRTVHNSCNVKRGLFTAGSENKTVPKSSRMLARCCSTRCCFTLPYLFPCYFLTRDSKPSFVTTRFSLLLQNMSTSHPCKCPQFQQNFGKSLDSLGNPPKKTPSRWLSHGLRALHQRLRLHLRVGRGGHRHHRRHRCRRCRWRAASLGVWVAVYTWIAPLGLGKSQMT